MANKVVQSGIVDKLKYFAKHNVYNTTWNNKKDGRKDAAQDTARLHIDH